MKEKKPLTRKKFLTWSAAVASVLAIPALFFGRRGQTTQTTKMLTEDGRLVEIEVKNIPAKKKRIADDDIHTWVKTKPGSKV